VRKLIAGAPGSTSAMDASISYENPDEELVEVQGRYPARCGYGPQSRAKKTAKPSSHPWPRFPSPCQIPNRFLDARWWARRRPKESALRGCLQHY